MSSSMEPGDQVRVTIRIREGDNSNVMEVQTADGVEVPNPNEVAVILLDAVKAIVMGTMWTPGGLS